MGVSTDTDTGTDAAVVAMDTASVPGEGEYLRELAFREVFYSLSVTSHRTLFLLFGTTQEARCAYAIGIMAVYWCTEALPIAATSLLPVILFPLLGVLGSRELCSNYFKVSHTSAVWIVN